MAIRKPTTGPKLPYLTDRAFEEEAALLLSEYGAKHGVVTAPPVPIDEIAEHYLELQLEFSDMQQLFGVDDVHGALWVNERRVGIDQRLDPATNRNMLGRYRFTLAHEAGHWRLHRHLFQRQANQLRLLPEGVERPEYICRSSDAAPIEYQANRFASCLLMPREMVVREWQSQRGSTAPIYLDDLRARRQEILTAEVLRRGGLKTGDDALDNMLMEHVSRPLADTFEVSPDAMRIRLEGMKFLLRKKEPSLFE
jgi:hypothetical protein